MTRSTRLGGSLGTVLLSTLAATAATSFITDPHTWLTPTVIAPASLHGYHTAFTVSACLFAAGAILAGLLFQHRSAAITQLTGEPRLAL